MKKIVIVSDTAAPQVNGVSTAVTKTTEMLEKRGHSVTVIHPELFKTVPLPFYPEVRIAVLPEWRMKKLLDEAAPEFIHIMTEGPLGMAARSYCIQKKKQFTTSYHTQFHLHFDAWFGSFTDLPMDLMRKFHSRASATFVTTERLKTDLEEHGFKNIVVAPLGVDTELFAPDPSHTSDLPKPIFVYLGRLSPEKNIEEFLDAKLSGTKLVIGGGPDRKKLEQKYPDAVFVGYQRGEALAELLSTADVFVFPSRTETFGLVMLEALACGLPVAAHNVTGPAELITQGVDGYLGEDLTEAATQCLTLSREACRKKALQYSWESAIHAFESHLVPVSGS